MPASNWGHFARHLTNYWEASARPRRSEARCATEIVRHVGSAASHWLVCFWDHGWVHKPHEPTSRRSANDGTESLGFRAESETIDSELRQDLSKDFFLHDDDRMALWHSPYASALTAIGDKISHTRPRSLGDLTLEAAPLLVREIGLVVETLDRIRQGMPLALRALDVDNGPEILLALTCEPESRPRRPPARRSYRLLTFPSVSRPSNPHPEENDRAAIAETRVDVLRHIHENLLSGPCSSGRNHEAAHRDTDQQILPNTIGKELRDGRREDFGRFVAVKPRWNAKGDVALSQLSDHCLRGGGVGELVVFVFCNLVAACLRL